MVKGYQVDMDDTDGHISNKHKTKLHHKDIWIYIYIFIKKIRKKSIVLFNSNWTVKLNYLQSCHKMPTGNQDIILPC